MYCQIDNMNKEREITNQKEKNGNSRFIKYNDWNEKFTTVAQ